MRYLVPAGETNERFKLLVSLTEMRSAEKIEAPRLSLVDGWPLASAAFKTGVDLANVKKSLHELDRVAEKVESIKALDWKHFNTSPRV